MEMEIKGFSLGMDLDAAMTHCRSLFKEVGIPLRAFEEAIRQVDQSVFIVARADPEGEAMMEISASPVRRVFRVVFYPASIKPLFEVGRPRSESIAKRLMSDFNVPPLTKSRWDEDLWEYEVESEEGFVVRVSVQESVVTMEVER
jgi:hypothetical protein